MGMRRFFAPLAFAALIAAPAAASDLDALKGRFGFNWFVDPSKSQCVKIDDKLLKTFASPAYACNLKPDTASASGQPAVKCSSKDGKVEYLIFTTLAGCQKEHETQADNSE